MSKNPNSIDDFISDNSPAGFDSDEDYNDFLDNYFYDNDIAENNL